MKFRILTLLIFFISLHCLAGKSLQGVYEVPISEDLKPFAKYVVDYQIENNSDSPAFVSFQLPLTLVGRPIEITMQKMTETLWIGPNVIGKCETKDAKQICSLEFSDITSDIKEVEKILNNSNLTQWEIQGRLAVAAAFSGEPIGVVTYSIYSKKEKCD